MKSTWSSSDIELFKKLQGIINRGYFVDSKQLADLHNRVLGTQIKPTGCSNCNKVRFNTLLQSYNNMQEELKKQEDNNEKETSSSETNT